MDPNKDVTEDGRGLHLPGCLEQNDCYIQDQSCLHDDLGQKCAEKRKKMPGGQMVQSQSNG